MHAEQLRAVLVVLVMLNEVQTEQTDLSSFTEHCLSVIVSIKVLEMQHPQVVPLQTHPFKEEVRFLTEYCLP